MKSISDMTREELKVHLFKLHPKVLLASIPDNISDNDPLLNELMQTVYDKNFEAFRVQFTGTEIASLEPEYIREQKHKLTEFDLMLHSTANRIKVVRYLQFLDTKGITASLPVPTKTKPCESWRRVYSFIIVHAYNKKKIDVFIMGKKEFLTYVSDKLNIKDVSPVTIYQTVKCSYKGEKSYGKYFLEMAKAHPKDYDYAMMIYKDFFPD